MRGTLCTFGGLRVVTLGRHYYYIVNIVYYFFIHPGTAHRFMTEKSDRVISSQLLDVLPPVIRAIRSAMSGRAGARFTVPQFRVLGFVSLQPCTSKQLAEWQG